METFIKGRDKCKGEGKEERSRPQWRHNPKGNDKGKGESKSKGKCKEEQKMTSKKAIWQHYLQDVQKKHCQSAGWSDNQASGPHHRLTI